MKDLTVLPSAASFSYEKLATKPVSLTANAENNAGGGEHCLQDLMKLPSAASFPTENSGVNRLCACERRTNVSVDMQ